MMLGFQSLSVHLHDCCTESSPKTAESTLYLSNCFLLAKCPQSVFCCTSCTFSVFSGVFIFTAVVPTTRDLSGNSSEEQHNLLVPFAQLDPGSFF